MSTSQTQVKNPRRDDARRGQALVEFTLVAPILILLLLGLIDFGVILFTYAQASNSLREALRYAEILGYSDDVAEVPYLNCADMRDAAQNNYFTDAVDVTITYQKADGTTPWSGSGTYDCPTSGDLTATEKTTVNDGLVNGDILAIQLKTTIKPFFLPFGPLSIDFDGQRTIVKNIPLILEDRTSSGVPTGTIKVCLKYSSSTVCPASLIGGHSGNVVSVGGVTGAVGSDGCITFGKIDTKAYEIVVPSVLGSASRPLRLHDVDGTCTTSTATTFSVNGINGETVTVIAGYR